MLTSERRRALATLASGVILNPGRCGGGSGVAGGDVGVAARRRGRGRVVAGARLLNGAAAGARPCPGRAGA